MKVVIRSDASLAIGSGHVMRCLTLADELSMRGVKVSFICRELPGQMIDQIEGRKGYPTARLPQPEAEYVAMPEDVAHAIWLCVSWERDAVDTIKALGDSKPQWLIIDHYAIDQRWEEKLRPYVGKIMVIDDLADRQHDCDLLLDQNLYDGLDTRYSGLVPETCTKLLGPHYALLRPEFAEAHKNLRQRDGNINKVLVFFGGVDPSNETEKALQALSVINDRMLEVDVVVGISNLHKEQIQCFCASREGFNYHCQIDNMAELLVSADLAIGAGGTATWERCYLGLPSISIVIADNQYEITKAVAAAGGTVCLGYCSNVNAEDIATTLRHLLKNPLNARDMGKRALSIMGSGPSQKNRILVDVIIGDGHAKA
ncbi:MAG: UDP-2,4-diacetamido-2,4,6-trideoxy-beta-L-altropyranose hydrolase [Desulfuromonadales bacterium]